MSTEHPPLVDPREEMAPEAMINEGGAISQPRKASSVRHTLRRYARDYPLEMAVGAFMAGLLIGWIARDD